MNLCHVCKRIAVHSDAALCLTCSAAADRGEVRYDHDSGWCAAPEVALPDGSELGRSTVREGSGRATR